MSFKTPSPVHLELWVHKSHHISTVTKTPLNLMFKFSSWPKLLRVTAYCQRFIEIFVLKFSKSARPDPQFLSRSLSMIEIQQAGTFWIKFAQASSVSCEIRAFNDNGEIEKNSPLKRLNTFLNVHYAPGRGNKSHKTYVALFICCCTRAVHLELVSDYSSAAFLAAFQRFSSRRGRPAHLYNDNGTTFMVLTRN